MKRATPPLPIVIVLLSAAIATVVLADGENLLDNGNFENGFTKWRAFWAKDGTAACGGRELIDSATSPGYVHSGSHAAHLTHTCKNSFTVEHKDIINVTYEERLEVSYWVLASGNSRFKMAAVLYNEAGSALSWDISGASEVSDTNGEWVHVTGLIWIKYQEASYVMMSCTGAGPGEVYVDDIELRSIGRFPLIAELSTGDENSVEMQIDTQTGVANVTMPGTDLRWEQVLKYGPKISKVISFDNASFNAMLDDKYNVSITLTKGVPEIVYKISSDVTESLYMYPHFFMSKEGHVIIPLNEGISFPVTSATEYGDKFFSFSNPHETSMAFWGVVDNTSAGPGYMAIVDTPDDAGLRVNSYNGYYCPFVSWGLQKGKWAYDRVIRFRFFKEGGHVRMAKIFREYRKAQGHLVTLEEKRKRNPNVDKLVGSPNIWATPDPRTFVPEMQSLGMQRMLWSSSGSSSKANFMNNNVSDVLTGTADIYQDVMDPDIYQYLASPQSNWVPEAFPDEIVYNSNGEWKRGWSVQAKNGTWYYCGRICDKMALKYARNRTTKDLETHDYRARFIDTTTATGWHECYHKDHPMTRTESKEWRIKLLDLFYTDFNLVVGSETGHEVAVPYIHYFEGMMSLAPYRIDEAGRKMFTVIYDVPERIPKFQLGHVFRIPLWELVYHDCVVSYWYWGDYNNKLPAVWDKRDLFNALYGTPPMYLINETGWATYKDRFVQSYNNTVPITREVGYSEMLNHEFLTENRDVQQTTFLLNKTHVKKVIVNFGTEAPYEHPETGVTVNPMSYYTYLAEHLSETSSSSSESELSDEDKSSSSESKHKDAGMRPQAVSLYLCLLLAAIILF